MRLIYHPEADAEIVAAAEFYEGRVDGLGAEFLDAIDRAADGILAAPTRWPVLEAEMRRFLMTRFPYAIYYRILSDEIRVLAVKHHSRHPDYWRPRETS